jgi:hypothetical protein
MTKQRGGQLGNGHRVGQGSPLLLCVICMIRVIRMIPVPRRNATHKRTRPLTPFDPLGAILPRGAPRTVALVTVAGVLAESSRQERLGNPIHRSLYPSQRAGAKKVTPELASTAETRLPMTSSVDKPQRWS